jgi:hypothetical protein
MNTNLIDLNAIPASGSISIRNHTYTWKKYGSSRMMLTKDNYGNYDTDLEVEVGLPDLFNYSDKSGWDLGTVGEVLWTGAVNELGEDYIDQFEDVFEWFAKNFPANAGATKE